MRVELIGGDTTSPVAFVAFWGAAEGASVPFISVVTEMLVPLNLVTKLLLVPLNPEAEPFTVKVLLVPSMTEPNAPTTTQSRILAEFPVKPIMTRQVAIFSHP